MHRPPSNIRPNNAWIIFGLCVLSTSAWSQTVTLSELEGRPIEFGSVHQMKTFRDGRTWFNQLHTVGRAVIGPEGKITTRFQNTAVFPNGVKRVGPVRDLTSTIGAPAKRRFGEMVWVFADGTLTRLLVFDDGAGGHKLTLAFERQPDGLSCTYSMPWMREDGVGEIRADSVVDGMPVKILDFKQLSSRCNVAKR